MPWLLRLLAVKYGPRIARRLYAKYQAQQGKGRPSPPRRGPR